MPQVPKTGDAAKVTPLMQLNSNLYAKLEGFNVGGSIKDRAVMQIVMGMLDSGKMRPGDTLCVCTSGNAGRSLLHVQEQLARKGIEIKVKIFMPKRYLTRDVPNAIIETQGVDTVKGDRESSFFGIPHTGELSRFLHGLDGEFMEVQEKMSKLSREHGWVVLDQHFDVNSMYAHQSTAEEIYSQLPSITDAVCTTGTGGTASGLRKFLPAHVNVHARPAKPGDIDGITDVRRYDNFCDTGLLEGFGEGFFDKGVSVDNMKELQEKYNITAGESSGAAFALAKDIIGQNPTAKVVFIAADGHTTDATSTLLE
jgi:cysteine synthase A